MANQFKIPDTLIVPIMQRIEEGMTTPGILKWLAEEKNIHVSQSTFSKRLAQFRREARIAKRAEIQDIAVASIVDSVSILQDKIALLETEIKCLMSSSVKSEKALAGNFIQIQLKLISELSRMTGLSPEKDDQMEDVREEMLAELNAIDQTKSN